MGSDAHFPSHQCPITLQIPSVATLEPITTPEHRRRCSLFPPNPERLTEKYNAAFARVMSLTSPASVHEKFQLISDAHMGAARTVYREPAAYDRLPTVLRKQHESSS